MTTHDALLAAVLANPQDDLPRLVYADHLDESAGGYSPRAEFIRVQVELAAVNARNDGLPLRDYPGSDFTRRLDLERRERELFKAHFRGWFGDRWALMNLSSEREDALAFYPETPHAFVDRGFISGISCTLADWCGGECPVCRNRRGRTVPPVCPACNNAERTTGIGPAVVAAHPVELVTLTDRELNSRGEWCGVQLSRHEHDLLCSHFPTRDSDPLLRSVINGNTVRVEYKGSNSAEFNISAALIAWAKSQPHPARIIASPVSVDFVTG